MAEVKASALDSETRTQQTSQDMESQRGRDGVSDAKSFKESNAVIPAKAENVVDWDGPNDPANPMNWSSAKKFRAIGMVSLITFLSPLASTIISPAAPDVMKTFHSTNETLEAFVTSIYVLAYAFGPLFLAPLSESIGRAPVYNACNFVFLVFSIACAVAQKLSSLIVFRFLAGVGASCPITIGAGTIADMVPREKRGVAMAAYIMGPLIGPTIGPLIGGYLAQSMGWRWIFWLMSILVSSNTFKENSILTTVQAAAVCVLTFLFMRESYAYIILERKTHRLRKKTGNPNLRSALDTGKAPIDLFKFSIMRPLKMLLLSPIVFLMSLYMAIVYGYVYLLFTTYPRVFQGQYGFSNGSIGLTYLGSGIGSFFGLTICGAVSDRLVTALTKRNGGIAKPEYRVPPMFVGSLLIPTGLFIYGWTAENKVHWMVPIFGTGLLGAGLFFLYVGHATRY
ncbi:hypothetical protein ACLMJK_002730 [Lecanora helva]